jgi:FkbM family methyltransferase
VREGTTVLDVGANVGAHTLHLARLVGDKGRVIACEPTDFAVAKLKANLKSNPALEPRVQVHQVFLVEEGKNALVPALASSWPVDGTTPDDAEMCSRSMTLAGASARSLDSILAAASDPVVALMKMDVDGYELEVLRGARRLLERSRPTVVMELAPYVFHPGGKFDELVALLVENGYEFHPLGSLRALPSSGPALRALIPRGGSLNVVAAPKPVG